MVLKKYLKEYWQTFSNLAKDSNLYIPEVFEKITKRIVPRTSAPAYIIIKFLKTVDNNTKYTGSRQIEMTIALPTEQDFSIQHY